MIKKFLGKNKEGSSPKKSVTPSKNKSTQSWLPIVDVNNRLIYRRDNYVIAAIRVQPNNIDLLSEKEKHMKIISLHEVKNGIDFEIQIFTIPRPVDLDGYIARLEVEREEESNLIKKRLLDGYIRQAAQLATTGEALERHFYVLLKQKLTKNSKHDENEILARANELAMNLSGASLQSHVCNDQELRDVLFIFSNPSQAAFERAPNSSQEIIQAIYQGG